MADPWMKFYPADWRADQNLRLCSLAARGLWIELMGIMHEAAHYGHLLVGGRAPDDAEIAKLVGSTPAEVRRLRAELLRREVPGIGDDGVWRSRRMVRDDERKQTNRANGGKGGNPRLVGSSDNQHHSGSDNRLDNPLDKPSRARVPEARSQKPERETISPEPTTAERRAGAWLERFPERYFEARGVGYVGNSRRDFENAVRIAQAVPDDRRLDLLTDVFLRAEHRDLEHQTRTPGRMAAMLPALEEHLNTHLARRTA